MKHFIFLIIVSVGFSIQVQAECRPQPDPGKSQYILGIGSLINTESRQKTLPNVDTVIPVLVKKHKRLFNVVSKPKGSHKKNKNNIGGVFLGVIKGKISDKFNAILFKIDDTKQITDDLDKRERLYCRIKISPKQIIPYKERRSVVGEIWAYSPMPKHTGTVSESHPIRQSYADEFMSGCIEIEESFGIEEFAQNCAKTTVWGLHWIKNRNKDSKRHKVSDSVATQIDKVLSSAIPKIFHNRIEVKAEN
jgi:hypothetical protein